MEARGIPRWRNGWTKAGSVRFIYKMQNREGKKSGKNMKNRIEGIIPFNEFWFRNCYYRQLVTGLSALEVDTDKILFNSITFARPGFRLDERGIVSGKRLEAACGYRVDRCELEESGTIACINSGKPVIIGVDCYEIKERKDTYRKKHIPHFVLIYGYDSEAGTFDIIDHNYINDFNYIKKVAYMADIRKAQEGYKKFFGGKTPSCHILQKRRGIKKEIDLISELYKKKQLKASFENSMRNLQMLEGRIDSWNLQTEAEAREIYKYLDGMRSALCCMTKAEGGLFLSVQSKIAELIREYNLLEWTIWRQNKRKRDFAVKNKQELSEKIMHMILSERELSVGLETVISFYQRQKDNP